MKILSVVGARPNFMKIAPIIRALEAYGRHPTAQFPRPDRASIEIQHVLVHTGQHYDEAMSKIFFRDLELPRPDRYLDSGSGSHCAQTADIMRKLEEVLLQEMPDLVIVVGDVNSTLAGALVAAKTTYDPAGRRPLISHVEAGLRSFDRSMPEEINRIVTDHLSDLLFVTEESGLDNLASEGIPREKVHFVGNTMIDSLMAGMAKAEASPVLELLGLRGGPPVRRLTRYALLTLHRPANVDNREKLLSILDGLSELQNECPVIFPAHPRTRIRIQEFRLAQRCHAYNQMPDSKADVRPCPPGGIRMVEPLGYVDFVCLMMHASVVVTDSGGIQEETTCLGVPCVTVRDNTERPVTVEKGTNLLAGTTEEGIRRALRRQLKRKRERCLPNLWDGKAANRIVDVLVRACQERSAGSRWSAQNQPAPAALDAGVAVSS